MQLILNTDIDTGLQNKMSTIEQKSLDKKFDHTALIENLIKDYEGQKDDNKSNEKPLDPNNDIPTTYGERDSAEDKEILSEEEEVLNAEENKDNLIEIEDKSPKEIELADKEVAENSTESEKNKKEKESNEKKETECEMDTSEDEKSEQVVLSCDSKMVAQNDEQFNSMLAVESSYQNGSMEVECEKQDVANHQPPYLVQDCDSELGEVVNSNDKTSHSNIENENVINIPDERDEDSIKTSEKQNVLQETINTHDNQDSGETNSNNEDQDKISDNDISSENNSNDLSTEDIKNVNVIKKKRLSIENSSEEKIKLTHICKLSNTLDILSDDEDELLPKDEKKESQNENVGEGDKLCINIDDDDDIMLVDEDNTSIITKNEVEEKTDKNDNVNESYKELDKINITQNIKTSPTEEETLQENTEATINTETKEIEENQELKPTAVSPKPKPLLPTNFLKTCKKNLADMTRDELEQFCIMKIVEGVVNRSNLAEIKTQLKTMAQNLDDYRKRTQMISKQNRDLQVVLKSVQEEQKKRPDHVINPLKITRSVGMQVLMTDKSSSRRKPIIGPNINKQNKSSALNNKKVQMIPVPRLVPATNNTNVTNKSPTAKQNSNSFINGVSVKSSPPMQKNEKRSHSKMQQNNPDTVDLTDDEPPNKQPQRNMNPPVRLVPPQNLMATPRQAFSTNINSPRKVYIPISGSQTQNVRPGQTFMLKAISPQQGARQRMASPLMCKQPSNVRMGRQLTRHPAPLPESTKQFEPPNWKLLPPAPELKLSKVENGIVISWKIDGFAEENYEEIASFQLYAYQETTSPPNTCLWKKIGDVKALPLPMACTLTQFMAGYKYYFAVRAVDVKSRVGPFSEPGSILLLNKM